jgi:hypothetical protein
MSHDELSTAARVTSWICQLAAAAILGQTLFFKFTAAEESVYIFSRLGMEPWGRIGTGVFELIAAALLLIPSLSGLGALLAMGLMSGAIFFHLTKLGIEVQGDAGLLFALAVIVFLAAAVVAVLRRHQIPLPAPLEGFVRSRMSRA